MKIKTVFLFLAMALFFSHTNVVLAVDRIERLKSRVKRGVDFYRDGRFTISKLTKQPLNNRTTMVRGFITNDTTRRAVSVQLEITCYNSAGDLLDTRLFDVNYLNSQETQSFQARIKERADVITLFEASVLDVIWDEF